MVINPNTNINSSDGRVKSHSEARALDNKLAAKETGSQTTDSPNTDVSLSSQAQSLSKLESQINRSPEVNAERVAELKKAIADGSYQINPQRIAQRMLDQDELFN